MPRSMTLPKAHPLRRWRVLLTVVPVAAALGLGLWTRQIESRMRVLPAVSPTPRYEPLVAAKALPGETPLDLERARVPRPIALRRGQALGGLLDEMGLAQLEAHGVIEALDDHVDLRRLRPGEIGLAYFDPAAKLTGLRIDVAGKGWVALERDGAGWTSAVHRFEREVRVRRIEGVLEGYLVQAVARAGGRPQVADAMSRVLQWDLDFNRDLRVGDRFAVLYEEVFLDGDFAGVGQVLALTYENRGRRHEAYRYGERGYYDADGRPLQKMFLRSPLPFTRVTSRFSNRRFHPILKVHRPHYGVDYGAPRGTPVRVTASGTVTFAGRNGGAGKMIRVRHANGYETSYLHLSGYARGVRRGKRLSQGEVIGYVGSTGLSTAPHLDYRVKRHGRWIDPLRLKSEPVKPIPAHLLADYLARRDGLREALATGRLKEPPRERPLLADRPAGDAGAGRSRVGR